MAKKKSDDSKEKDKTSGDAGNDFAKALTLVKQLVPEGEHPPTYDGSTMWNLERLAIWYGKCRTLSIYLGKDNVYQSQLTSYDPTKIKIDDPGFHRTMLGTLIAIQEYLETQ